MYNAHKLEDSVLYNMPINLESQCHLSHKLLKALCVTWQAKSEIYTVHKRPRLP